MNRFKEPDEIFEFNYSIKGFSLAERNIIKKLKKEKEFYLEQAEKELGYMKKDRDLDLVTIKDKKYPELLKNIFDPPPVLYIKGKIPSGKCVAVVGSRIASKYGHLEVVKYLVSNGANIHAQNDWALILASENGHLEVVKYLESL